MQIREVQIEDAPLVSKMFQKLDTETRFMLLEPGERSTETESHKTFIEGILESPNRIMLVVEIDGEIVGFASANGGRWQRIKHSMHLVIGIAEAYWRRGIGTHLMQEIEKRAKRLGIHRLDLTVMEHNQAARRLYRKIGFQEEGTKRDALKINGRYVNEIMMSKLLD